tara:strand:+ start:4752 stop:6056 length:1305 start_codon:yes stop_codon:yes gene_type:complete
MFNTKKIDYHAICNWFSTGFFFDNENFFLRDKDDSTLKRVNKKWHYSPRDITLDQAIENFSSLLTSLVEDNTKGESIILPLSGGLDSRTLAVVLRENNNVKAYSYEFEGGVKETEYARKIAEIYGWEFYSFTIPKGYLWNNIEEISNINNCRVEFTHPRQMAVMKQISNLGDCILSGSMGDLLFDSFEIPKNSNIDGQVNKVVDLIVKPGGKEIANALWQYWNLNGSFEQSLNDNIRNKLYNIEIDNPSSCIRAFKAIHYVKNWTNVNMKIFSDYKPVYAPYHDSKMRDFICAIPEFHLSNRKIQINYIKQKAPELAMIPWQNYDLNLYDYHKFNGSYLPRRGYRYIKRIFKEKVLRKTPIIQRNWELQFIGEKNDKNLKKWLFESPTLYQIVPKDIVEDYYQKFKKHNSVKYSHPVSMLLTLAVWTTKNLQNK